MDNAETIPKVEQAWRTHEMDALDDLFAPDFQAHTPGSDTLPAAGIEGARMARQNSKQAFPGGGRRGIDRDDSVDEGLAVGADG